jgi:hypothetical protein
VSTVTTSYATGPRRLRVADLPVWLVPLGVLAFQVMGSTGADHGHRYPRTPLHGSPTRC